MRMGVSPQILKDNQIPISTLNFLLHITCLDICREHEFSERYGHHYFTALKTDNCYKFPLSDLTAERGNWDRRLFISLMNFYLNDKTFIQTILIYFIQSEIPGVQQAVS